MAKPTHADVVKLFWNASDDTWTVRTPRPPNAYVDVRTHRVAVVGAHCFTQSKVEPSDPHAFLRIVDVYITLQEDGAVLIESAHQAL